MRQRSDTEAAALLADACRRKDAELETLRRIARRIVAGEGLDELTALVHGWA